MRTGNTRNLGIILAILIVLFILNTIFLFNLTSKSGINFINEPFEKVPKPITKAINTEKNEVIFRSNNELITNYAIYAFSVFCIFLVILSTVKLKVIN